jgi:hypothetical protein
MADRKRKVKQAIAESVEMSAAPAPKVEAPPPLTPAQKLKSFTLNPREKAEAAAPEHPRAVKGRGVRQEELNTAVENARQVRTRADIAGRTTTRGNVLTPAKIVGHTNKTRQGEKRVAAKPAAPELVMDSSQIVPAATKKPKPSRPRRLKKTMSSQMRLKGE